LNLENDITATTVYVGMS